MKEASLKGDVRKTQTVVLVARGWGRGGRAVCVSWAWSSSSR